MKERTIFAGMAVWGRLDLHEFRISRKNAVLGALVLLCAECAALTLARKSISLTITVMQLTLVLNNLIMLPVLFLRVSRSFHLKTHWTLVAVAYGLGAISNSWDTMSRYVFQNAPALYIISGRDLLAVFTYIPFFLLLSLPAGRRYFRHFIWIDLVQVVLAACLVFVVLFHALPFLHTPVIRMSGMQFYRLLELLSLVICAGLLLHFIAAVDADESRFFGYRLFTYSMATTVFIVNTEVSWHYPDEILTNFLEYGVILAAILIYYYFPAESVEPERRHSGSAVADLINIASPALPSAALVVLGIVVEPQHPGVGIASVAIAFVLFAVRATFYQRSFERSQAFLEGSRDDLARISMVDELTGIANRRAFDRAFTQEWERCTRAGSALSLLLIDVDHFKQLNDRFGHQAGDACLAAIAKGLQAALPRANDTIGRYGGDEFAAILPSTGVADAELVAERLVLAVNELDIANPATATGHATISLGIGSCEVGEAGIGGGNPKLLLRTADEALYRAKASGRNGWRSGKLVLGGGAQPLVPFSSSADAAGSQNGNAGSP
jgi:diguanylate cyclase (GGDEF)-like protein